MKRAGGVTLETGAGEPCSGPPSARRFHLTGVVQGVGFRPFVHRLATRFGLAGSVRNESGEVYIEVEGPTESLAAFERAIRPESPPLARIDALEWEEIPALGLAGFEVLPSISTSRGRLPVSPDVAMCDACRSELFDPADRRFGYPFITCTDCGPRYTVIESMPYDRERTSMRAFDQCPACLAEYRDPGDRRFHSETNSCHDCGPAVWFAGSASAKEARGDAAIAAAAALLGDGGILAMRGLGGFHLAVDAGNEAAVRVLRERKGRWEKPLAVMLPDLAAARRVAFLGPVDEELLASRERPIVLVRARDDSGLAASISPGLDTVGLMLAYTPLHLLLLREADGPLVMTSGNASELPIATGNEESRQTLTGIADAFLTHDREIVSRYDDSVLRVIAGSPTFFRRARGYAPLPVSLPVAASEPVLAVGPHLKNTFTLAVGDRAFVSQHIGDLENLETLEHFRAALRRYRELFRIEPRLVACDTHPGYLSTRVAEEAAAEFAPAGGGALPIIRVQHHHAHIAAVAAEHGLDEAVIGVAFDGTGHGSDGNSWGAEILVADLRTYRRVARMGYARMPGGDLAARVPWRAALGYRALVPGREAAFAAAFEGLDEKLVRLVEQQVRRGVNAPLASSMGRLFDAASAVLGLRRESRYEGQAAMELESLAWSLLAEPDGTVSDNGSRIRARASQLGVPVIPLPACEVTPEEETVVLEPGPLLAELGERRAAGADAALLAAAFHLSIADRTVETVSGLSAREGLNTVALSGGTFQNALLTPLIRDALMERGLRVLTAVALGPNDGSISYGQAAVAAALSNETGR